MDFPQWMSDLETFQKDDMEITKNSNHPRFSDITAIAQTPLMNHHGFPDVFLFCRLSLFSWTVRELKRVFNNPTEGIDKKKARQLVSADKTKLNMINEVSNKIREQENYLRELQNRFTNPKTSIVNKKSKNTKGNMPHFS